MKIRLGEGGEHVRWVGSKGREEGEGRGEKGREEGRREGRKKKKDLLVHDNTNSIIQDTFPKNNRI